MVSSLLCLPVSCCPGEQEAAPLDRSQQLAWSLNVLRWSTGSGSGPLLWVTGRVLSLSFCSPLLPAMYISQDCLLYSVCGSVEHSSLFHFVAFFNFSWDFFSTLLLLHFPHFLQSSWQPPLLTESVMALCILHSEAFTKANTHFCHLDFCPYCTKLGKERHSHCV